MTPQHKYIAGAVALLAAIAAGMWFWIEKKKAAAALVAPNGTVVDEKDAQVTPQSGTYGNTGPGNYVPGTAVNVSDRAKAIYRAGVGFGTDEKAIFNALSGLTTYQLQALANEFKSLYGESLLGYLQSELDDTEMYKAQNTYKLNTVKWN